VLPLVGCVPCGGCANRFGELLRWGFRIFGCISEEISGGIVTRINFMLFLTVCVRRCDGTGCQSPAGLLRFLAVLPPGGLGSGLCRCRRNFDREPTTKSTLVQIPPHWARSLPFSYLNQHCIVGVGVGAGIYPSFRKAGVRVRVTGFWMAT
jgi:hypothetical protein